MTHPEELLAGYVDGTLSEEERAVVDAHLSVCSTCREEVELARSAVRALASLEEVPVPLGVTGPVLAEAGARAEHKRSALRGRLQWVAGAAAAAVIVLVIAIGANMGGQDNAGTRAVGGAATGATGAAGGGGTAREAAAAAFDGVEVQRDVNYDEAGVKSLAQEASEQAADDNALSAPAPAAAPSPPGAAIDCLKTSGAPIGEPRDTLVRVIEAKYLRTPAYLAVFLESPGAGQAADKVVVWIAAKGNCGQYLAASSFPA